MNSKNPNLQVQFEEEVTRLLMIIEDMIDTYGYHKDLNKHMPDLIKYFNSIKTIQEQRTKVRTQMCQAILKY